MESLLNTLVAKLALIENSKRPRPEFDTSPPVLGAVQLIFSNESTISVEKNIEGWVVSVCEDVLETIRYPAKPTAEQLRLALLKAKCLTLLEEPAVFG